MGSRRRLLMIVLCIATAAATWWALGTEGHSSGRGRAASSLGELHRFAATSAPNLLVITTDDQTLAQFSRQAMPFTRRFFGDHGSTFSNGLSVPPLCCPSRAGFLTGEYAHNHGVLTNNAGYYHLTRKHNILPIWLERAGYRTGLVGKYLNGFPALGPARAPGWDQFFAAGGLSIGYKDFDVGANGTPRHYAGDAYSTRVYTRAAKRFMSATTKRDRRFFLWLTYNAPHTAPDGQPPCRGEKAQPETAADFDRFAHLPLPHARARHEKNLDDKGRWLGVRSELDAREVRGVEHHWRCALAALPSVDRGVHAIVKRLRHLGELDRTIIVFTSDNGYFYGEHAIPSDKKLPYEPALRVPLAVYVPPSMRRGPGPRTISATVSNVDLAPTLLDYAHGRPCKDATHCRTMDGHSLRGLMAGRTPSWSAGRTLPVELEDDFTYTAFRGPHRLFMRLTADRLGPLPKPEMSLYDLRRDAAELHNQWPNQSREQKRRLLSRLRKLSDCAGTTGPDACP